MRLLILCVLGVTFGACSRSAGLDSDTFDCRPGERVFTQNSGHCVYFIDEAPEQCPDAAPYRSNVGDFVICAGVENLSAQWLNRILDAAYPPEEIDTDAFLFTDGALIGTAIDSDADVNIPAPDGFTPDGSRTEDPSFTE